MRYCFCYDQNGINRIDSVFQVQKVYADAINAGIYYNLDDEGLTYSDGRRVFPEDMQNEIIHIRTTCDMTKHMIKTIEAKGLNVLESIEDVEMIAGWYNYGVHKRRIIRASANELFGDSIGSDLMNFLKSYETVFLKTEQKGLSVKCYTKQILENNKCISEIFLQRNADETILISENRKIKEDSVGKIEARFFVFDNCIRNCSRYSFVLKHSVPKVLRKEADEFVRLFRQAGFPGNYFLDLALFQKDNNEYVDVVEVNPITSSTCYINNSIFHYELPQIEGIVNKLGFGYEYAYDYFMDDRKYYLTRVSNKDYMCAEGDRYSFID